MTTETILLIMLAAFISLAISVFIYGYRSNLHRSLRWSLGILRFLSLFVLMILAINPKLRSTSYAIVKPSLVILADNSESITELGAGATAREIVKGLSGNQDLKSKFDITLLGFGTDLNLGDTLNFNEPSTNIGAAFSGMSDAFDRDRTAVVLLSDGNQTLGADYEYMAQKISVPVFPVVLGDTTRYEDLSLNQLNSNRYSFLKNSFPVEVLVTYNGERSRESEFRIRQGNKVIHSEQIQFRPGINSVLVNVNIQAEAVGMQRYIAEIQPLASEKNQQNNARQFAVEVIDQATNVIIARSLAHPDIGALRRSIETNQQRKVRVLSPLEALTSLEDCQLLILFQPDSHFRELIQAANTLSVNQLWITGKSTNWNFINSVQEDFYKEPSAADEQVTALFSQNFGLFGVADIGFEQFPPLSTSFGELLVLSPHQTVLEQSINRITTGSPILALLEDNSNRKGILDGDGIWKWRAQSYLNEGDFTSFDTFTGSLVQYLTSTRRRRRLDVNSQAFYYNNNPVRISAQYFDNNYVFDSSASLSIMVSPEEGGEALEFPLLIKNSYYEVDLSSLEAGDYTYTLSVSNQPVSVSGSFSVLDYGIERQFLRASYEKLERTAMSSGGQLYFPFQQQALVSNLLQDDRFKAVQEKQTKVVPLIEWAILLGLLALLLTLEWFIRKYNGLV